MPDAARPDQTPTVMTPAQMATHLRKLEREIRQGAEDWDMPERQRWYDEAAALATAAVLLEAPASQTLRDEFAKAALMGLLANEEFGGLTDAQELAAWAYRHADEMLSRRL